MTKNNQYRTKNKVIQETRAAEYEAEIEYYLRPHDPTLDEEGTKNEVIEWMKTQFTATAKSREILEDYFEGKPNTGERE